MANATDLTGILYTQSNNTKIDETKLIEEFCDSKFILNTQFISNIPENEKGYIYLFSFTNAVFL
jgi:hypothetical protein